MSASKTYFSQNRAKDLARHDEAVYKPRDAKNAVTAFHVMKPLFLVFCLFTTAAVSQAGALLKPTKSNTRNLQPRAMDIRAQVDGAFARTTITTVYANANRSSIEADFVYAAPPGAVVTGFAYWFGKEKVVAYISDRERAAQIYQVAQENASPSQVEIANRNVFRARISQVAARQDLRVQIELAAPLEREPNTLAWRYPLVDDTRDVTLDWLRVRVETDPNRASKNNMGAQKNNGDYLWRKYNFKPKVDTRVSFPMPPNSTGKLKADLSAEHRTDGRGGFLDDGFFALDLKSDKNPQSAPQISGITTSDITRIERPASGVARVFGRYSGSNTAIVTWGDQKTSVFFPRPPQGYVKEVQHLAQVLWGAHRIEDLSDDDRNKAKVVALSHSFNLLSKWTSWLAMPAKQRKQYDEQIKRLDTQRKGEELGRTLAIEIEANRPFSPVALQARAGLRALERSSVGRKTGFKEEHARQNALRARMKEVAKTVVSGRLGLLKTSARDATLGLKRLAETGAQDEDDFLRNAQQGLRFKQVKALKADYTNQVCALRRSDPKVVALQKRIVVLENRYGIGDDNFQSNALKLATQVVAKTTLEEALAGREDGERAARLRDMGERFVRELGGNSFDDNYFKPQVEERLASANDTLINEIEAGRENSGVSQSAKHEVESLYALAPDLRGTIRDEGSREWQQDLAWRARAHEAAYRLAQTKRDSPSDTAKIGELQSQLDYLSGHTEQDSDEFENAETKRLNDGEPLETARQYRLDAGGSQGVEEQTTPDESQQTLNDAMLNAASQYSLRPSAPLIAVRVPQNFKEVIAIMPDGTQNPLIWNGTTLQWEARFDVPTDGQDNHYTIQIMVVDSKGARTTYSMPFSVDTPKPTPIGEVGGNSRVWDLRLLCDSHTARVMAFLPWKQVELVAHTNGEFSQKAKVPTQWQGRKSVVRFVITDKAHATTEIEVSWS
ncbi:hypothetical protein IAD21_05896 [Abditibacteriota bacterium]|nr:hypothetical protein IAD21_05896 [Abditibacteriota bacterium]